jgi:hypothetical protein
MKGAGPAKFLPPLQKRAIGDASMPPSSHFINHYQSFTPFLVIARTRARARQG